MNTAPTHIGMLRHSLTLWNEKKRIQGQQDSPLSSEGVRMVRKWAEQLAPWTWEGIVCSDLGRARETARIIAHRLHLPVSVDTRLREQRWGEWTGMTLAQVKQQDIQRLQAAIGKGWEFQPPAGESRAAVLTRSREALLEMNRRWPGKHLLVVCHEGVMKCVLYSLCGRAYLPDEPKIIRKYHLHRLQVCQNELSLTELNALALAR